MLRRFIFICSILVFGFVESVANSLFTPSNTLPRYDQSSFEQYIKDNQRWLKENRIFLTKNIDLEIKMNSPFELKPTIEQKTSKSILLVHGLGDSPGYFRDVAQVLSSQGFLVRTILLTGHGSKPADLLNVEIDEWVKLVKHHIELLKQTSDEVWLGGFSTGTNLITSYALENEEEIKGMLLFSPGFASAQENLLAWSGIASFFKTWVFQHETSDNILKYDSLSMNAAKLYYHSVKKVQAKLANKKFKKPVLVTISENDSVINAEEIVAIFSKYFTHPSSQLIWYGTPLSSKDNRIVSMPSFLPQYSIGNFSHLATLFKEDNPIYGRYSTFKMLRNGQKKTFDENNDTLWYSAWGLKKEGIYFARLTWNPYFKEMAEIIKQVIQ